MPLSALLLALPLVVLQPTGTPSGTLAILITGDGGWSATDKAIAERLAADGTAVVGLNSLHYFAHKHTSAGMAADISELGRSYCSEFSCRRIVLIGYSMGADVLPFVVPQIAPDVQPKIAQVHLISLGYEAVFKFYPTQWMGLVIGHKFATLPQLALLHGIPIFCFYGKQDTGQACKDVPSGIAELIPIESGHVMTKAAPHLVEELSTRVTKLQ